MRIAVPSKDGIIDEKMGQAKEFTIVETGENGELTSSVHPFTGEGNIGVVSLLADLKVDVLICGTLGLMTRSALQMIEIELVPGCTGPVNEAVEKYLSGQPQGDPAILTVEVEMAENDPMQCMSDCAKCNGCHSKKAEIPEEIKKRIPEI